MIYERDGWRARNDSNVRPQTRGVKTAHTRSCLMARIGAGMAEHESGDGASDRPIFTLLHAGVGRCIEKPFGRYYWHIRLVRSG